MLQARELSVEVGGRLVVEGASLTVRARDKVGLVGRNGAGKTSLLRVLGGAAQPAGGTVHRTGALGYLPQDPRHRRLLDGATALTHVLSGRGLDEATVRIEKLRLAMEEDPSDAQRRAVRPGRGAVPSRRRLRGRVRGAPLAAGLGLAADRLDLPLGCSRAASAGGSSSPASCSRAATCCCSTSPPTTSTPTPRTWLMDFLRDYRGALLVISHDLDLLDEAITRVLHLDRADEDARAHGRVQGHLQPVPRRARRRTRCASPRWPPQQAAEIDRLPTLADRFGAKATPGEHGPQPREARRPHSRPRTSRGRPAIAR